jgi:peptidyl-Lys metalloendopeptidase
LFSFRYGTVYFCGAFWNAPNTDANSRAGTIVHESSHFTKNGGTDDFAYGHEDCEALAQSDQNKAINNADSHKYFAENDPELA